VDQRVSRGCASPPEGERAWKQGGRRRDLFQSETDWEGALQQRLCRLRLLSASLGFFLLGVRKLVSTQFREGEENQDGDVTNERPSQQRFGHRQRGWVEDVGVEWSWKGTGLICTAARLRLSLARPIEIR
jgi:hypothetical protein